MLHLPQWQLPRRSQPLALERVHALHALHARRVLERRLVDAQRRQQAGHHHRHQGRRRPLPSAHPPAHPSTPTAPHRTSLIPTGNGNTVRSFSTHGQQAAAKGSSSTVSRSDIRLIQYLDSSAHSLVRRWRLIGYFPVHHPRRGARTDPRITALGIPSV
jgi:hypothetical protein